MWSLACLLACVWGVTRHNLHVDGITVLPFLMFPVLRTVSTQNKYLFAELINDVERQRPLPNSRLTSLTDFTRFVYPRGLLDEREKGL